MTSGNDAVLSSAGASLLLSTARAAGLGRGLSRTLAPWRRRGAVHDPGKVVFDLAVAVALGGDCLADLAVVRAQPELFGTVASDATVSRLLEHLAGDVEAVIAAIRAARAAARERVWRRRDPLPAAGPVIVDLDATLVTAHSDKENATPTFKRGYGFHPLLAFVDHDPATGTGEPLAGMLRAGNAGANTAADQIAVLDAALAQLPEPARSRVLVRGDTGSGVKAFLAHVHQLGLGYSVGMYGQAPLLEALEQVPRQAWRDAREADGTRRDGAQVAELTRWLPASFTGWPPGIRVIARRERPHPGAQLRITDHAGWRITMFATNTKGGRIADLEVRHRLRARAEDRIRTLKDTGLRNLPLHAFAKNQLWLEIASLAAELLAFTQTLAWHGKPASRWEPKRLRLRICFADPVRRRTPGAQWTTRDPPDQPNLALGDPADQRSPTPRGRHLSNAPPPLTITTPRSPGEPADPAPETSPAHHRPERSQASPTPTTSTTPTTDERSRLRGPWCWFRDTRLGHIFGSLPAAGSAMLSHPPWRRRRRATCDTRLPLSRR